MKPYVVELEGFNDGLPYREGSFETEAEARGFAAESREKNPQVRWRVIKIVEEFV